MSERNPYLTIQGRLSEYEQADILRKTVKRDPNLEGAYVADVLDIYDNGDALLSVREPFYERYRDRFDAFDKTLIKVATIAAAILTAPDCQFPEMLGIVRRLAGGEDAEVSAWYRERDQGGECGD